jgi:nicotinic acid phosphoribosyltransferase
MNLRVLLFFAYTIIRADRPVMFGFVHGFRRNHAVEITASTLYEAAVLALEEFRRHGFADATFGPGTKLTVKVRQPELSHVVSVGRLRSWLDGSGKSADSGARRTGFRGDREKRSGVKTNTIPG